MNLFTMKKIASIMLILLLGGTAAAGASDSTDTSGTVAAKKAIVKATARLHSMGLFSYGGRLVSHNHVMDVHVVYNRKTWGFQFFKAVDLHDRRTPINFAMAAFNRPFHLGDRLTLTPHVGILLEQTSSLADYGSDVAGFLTASYRLRPNFTVEYTGIFANLVIAPGHRDWINRLRLLYTDGHLDVTLFGWHNNQVFDAQTYGAVGISVFMSRLPLSGPFSLQTGLTGLYMASASEERLREGASGLFLTLGVTVN